MLDPVQHTGDDPMEFMLKVSMLFLVLAVLAAVIALSALTSVVGSFAQVLVAAFGALFVVSLAITIGSFAGERPTD